MRYASFLIALASAALLVVPSAPALATGGGHGSGGWGGWDDWDGGHSCQSGKKCQGGGHDDHGNGSMSLYAPHEALRRDDGARVKRGEPGATDGNSGSATLCAYRLM